MKKIKAGVINNFELIAIGVILTGFFFINYHIYTQVTFLYFYFLPVIMAGYFLGPRPTITVSFLCIAVITIYCIWSPGLGMTLNNTMNLYLHIVVWGGVLTLTGISISKTSYFKQELLRHQKNLDKADKIIGDYKKNFDDKLKKRTEELEKSSQSIESLKVKLEKTLYSTMDAKVAKLLIEGRLRNEKRKISVMFSDLVGFTGYSEDRSPEIVVQDLNSYLSCMEPVMFDYHAHIDKYLGDGIMCEFGAPLDYENYRLLAVMAAIKMQETLTRLNYPWQMRIGISSGPVIMGIIGHRRQAYTTIGDVVNLASRIEKECPPGSVLLDEFTRRGVDRFIDVRLKKDISQSENIDEKMEASLDEMHRRLNLATSSDVRTNLFYKIGQLHMSSSEPHDAMHYFEQALLMRPDNTELKVAFAEAMIKRDKNDKIKVRGRKKRIAVYEVIGIKDVLLDREKFPASFLGKYPHVEELVEMPVDIIMPVEAMDGCIGHSKVVALLSYAVATELGLSEKEKKEILNSGFVADIGKKILPHHLLNRMGSLNSDEIKIVQQHSTEGARILDDLGYTSELMQNIIQHSHENYNGSGYPDGLRKNEIPIGARIIAVVDTYDALTSWRPYREKWDRHAALEELLKCVDKGLFDPGVVKALVKVMD
ncbi:MAG: adenylate/guanylate cyclase domain-containing protein [Desulfobacterales bacterium]|nr:adenylate/guanylate cyclase domain-containing protein [Desulfobacterales bacterium]